MHVAVTPVQLKPLLVVPVTACPGFDDLSEDVTPLDLKALTRLDVDGLLRELAQRTRWDAEADPSLILGFCKTLQRSHSCVSIAWLVVEIASYVATTLREPTSTI